MLKMELLNLNERFSRSKFRNLIQDLIRNKRMSLRDALYDILPTGGTIENYPHCFCQHYRYETRLGETCPKCGTEVKHRTEEAVDNLFHIAKPYGIDKFLNPKIYMDIVELCRVSGRGNKSFNPIYYLTIESYSPTSKLEAKEVMVYDRIRAWGVPRNWNYFVNNIRELVPRVFDLILSVNAGKNKNYTLPPEMKATLELLNYSDDLVFCDVLPIINKMILVIEQTGDIKKKSPTTGMYGAAITDIIALPTEQMYFEQKLNYTPEQLRKVCNTVGKAYRGLDDYFRETIAKEGKKGGLCRSDTLGLRSPFTWRAVITQICTPHRGDEIHMPYTASTFLLEPYIMNILSNRAVNGMDRPYTPEEALDFLAKHRRSFSQTLHDIMTEIIYSFTDKGLPTYHIRYPTLYSQSGQLQYITVIKADVDDKTCGVPAACLSGMNGDFDGKINIRCTNITIYM